MDVKVDPAIPFEEFGKAVQIAGDAVKGY